MDVKPLEVAIIWADQVLEIPILWSANSVQKIVNIGGLLGRRPSYTKIKVKIDAVWPWPAPYNAWLTIKVNGLEQCTLPMQVTDWQEYDIMDAVKVGDNLFEAVLWTTVPLVYKRGVKFTVYLDTDAPIDVRYPTQPPQLWWYALAGLVGLSLILALTRR